MSAMHLAWSELATSRVVPPEGQGVHVCASVLKVPGGGAMHVSSRGVLERVSSIHRGIFPVWQAFPTRRSVAGEASEQLEPQPRPEPRDGLRERGLQGGGCCKQGGSDKFKNGAQSF